MNVDLNNVNLDFVLIVTVLGSAAAVVGLIYSFIKSLKDDLRNSKIDIKQDINSHIDLLNRKIEDNNIILDKRMGYIDLRMAAFESKMQSIDERMFLILTGKKLEDAILEERMKHPRTDP